MAESQSTEGWGIGEETVRDEQELAYQYTVLRMVTQHISLQYFPRFTDGTSDGPHPSAGVACQVTVYRLITRGTTSGTTAVVRNTFSSFSYKPIAWGSPSTTRLSYAPYWYGQGGLNHVVRCHQVQRRIVSSSISHGYLKVRLNDIRVPCAALSECPVHGEL